MKGIGEKKNINWKNIRFGRPPVPTIEIWRADCFPESERTESKLEYLNKGGGSKLIRQNWR